MIKATRRRLLQAAASAILALPNIARAADTIEISFYFPVAVGGPITKIIDGYAADFQREDPAVKVTPVYAGTYQDTLTKSQTALKANSGPQMAVLLSTDAFSLIDDDMIVPFDTLASSDADRAWLHSFYPAFLQNGEIAGHTWGVPFQRSTIVLYWNKAAFQEAGLDPERPPATWAEHAAFAEKLTKRNGGEVDRWGVQIPATGFTYWLFQALATEAGGTLANIDGTETDFASPACVEALRYWIDLAGKYHAHPPGIVDWGTTPRDFLEQKVAMIWHTTGNLSNIRANAKFPFGVVYAAGRQAARLADWWRQFLSVQGGEPAAARSITAFPALDQQPRARRAMGHRHRLCGDHSGRLGHAGDAGLCRRLSGRRRGARPVAIRRG